MMGIITGTVKRTSGEVWYEGQEITQLGAEFRKKIGYMPQEQGLYEEFSARRFLYYMAELKGIRGGQRKTEVERALIATNLRKDAHRKIRDYSGGMKQRVMVAQALLGQPEILLLDEPTVGLDPKERLRFCGYIRELAQDRIVLITTHIVSDIEQIAKEVLFLKSGNLVAAGRLNELMEEAGAVNLEQLYMHYLGE